jgi:hypothetical protein
LARQRRSGEGDRVGTGDPVSRLVREVARGRRPEVAALVAPAGGWAAAASVRELLAAYRLVPAGGGAFRLVPGRGRKVSGAYYTSPALVDRLVRLTLDPLLEGITDSAALSRLRILDPCVGGGAFLAAAGRRLVGALSSWGLGPVEAGKVAAGCLWGVDSDRLAVDVTRGVLGEALGCPRASFAHRVKVGDALTIRVARRYDAVVGNPPWEIVKPNSREFFAQYDPGFRRLSKQAAVARARDLCRDPRIAGAWADECARVEVISRRVRRSGDFRHQGPSGDANTYKLFIERSLELVRPGGRVGLIVPSGFHTDLGSRNLRRLVFEENTVDCLIGLENRRGLFPIDRRFKFDLLVLTRGGRTTAFGASFMAHDPDQGPDLTVSLEDIRRFAPMSLSLPEFRTAEDARVAASIYGRWPLLGRSVEGAWALDFRREFDLTADSHLFNGDRRGLPLWEGKLINQYDPAFAEPRHWVEEEAGRRALAGRRPEASDHHRLVVRTIAASTNQRTLIAAVVPPGRFLGNSLLYASRRPAPARGRAPYLDELHFACALLNSFVLDYLIRQKVSTNVNKFFLEQLPLPRLTRGDRRLDDIARLARRLGDGEGGDGSPVRAERVAVRAVVEARVAHLYGLAEADYRHVLMSPHTFPAVDEELKVACLEAFRGLSALPEVPAAAGELC